VFLYSGGTSSPHPGKPHIRGSDDVASRASPLLQLEHEVMQVLLLNRRHWLLHTVTLDSGKAHAVPVHPHNVFRPALLAYASALVLVHNHPTGDPEPSAPDLEFTRELAAAGRGLCRSPRPRDRRPSWLRLAP
jgi:DNA repair protein RadC